jgi:signal transduction histidine kinase
MGSLSLRARLTIWCVGVVAGTAAALAAVVLVLHWQIGLRRIDAELASTQAQLRRMLGEELRERDAPPLAAAESLEILASANRPIAVLADTGAMLARRFDGPDPARVERPRSAAPAVRTLADRGGEWRTDVRREVIEGTPFVLIVASPLGDLRREQGEVREALAIGVPIALLLAAAGGLWIASAGLGPVSAMARRAASLPLTGEDDLGPPARDDELGQLTRAFNALVARLRAALRTQRQFMADASHELRSPVSVIRTAAEVALSREQRPESEYREALAIAAAQSRRLGALVGDMLVLARADAGGYPLRPIEGFLDDAIDECRAAVAVLAAERGVQVVATGVSEVALRADQELLRRLLTNLLQNAVQHSPAGETVTLDVQVEGPLAVLRVRDAGAGIAPGDWTRIFDRFVQLDASRRSDGAGLGLTIARWIAEAHGGSLAVEASGAQGTTFRLTLPTARATVPSAGAITSPSTPAARPRTSAAS